MDKMKRIPMRENMEVTLSAIIKALIWLEVACTAMLGVLLAVSMRGLRRVDSGQRPALWWHAKPQIGKRNCLNTVDDGGSSR